MEQLEATVAGTIFRNDQNGYTVMTLEASDTQEEFTAVGTLPELSPGEMVLLEGDWIEHPRFGRQLKLAKCRILEPVTKREIERYLTNCHIRGIKADTARKIVAQFGEDALRILSEHPERLTEVRGIGEERAATIAKSYREHQACRNGMLFLQDRGVEPVLAAMISARYREKTEKLIRENPYRLCTDMTEEVSFTVADRLAMSLGIPPEDDQRIQAAFRAVLAETASSVGHVWLPEQTLLENTSILLRVPEELCARGLEQLALAGDLIRVRDQEEHPVYLTEFFRAEKEVALLLHELMAAMPERRSAAADAGIDLFEKRNGIQFNHEQREAVRRALGAGVLVITGGPGTGKTTLIKCVLELIGSRNVLLCAPTGRAAKRMEEATGQEAKTIHRLLEYNEETGFGRNRDHPLKTRCVIVDEMSMVDLMLMQALMRAIPPRTRLILVGDADQLPSVGAGNVLGDILQSGAVPVIRLTEIYRQANMSRIVVNAHRVNHGEMPLLNEKGTDFFFNRCYSFSETASCVVDLMTRRLPGYLKIGQREEICQRIQVLTPTKKGDCGTVELNRRLQQELNPPSEHKPECNVDGRIFRLGDKVMQIRNNYDMEWETVGTDGEGGGTGVFNGDTGVIVEIDKRGRTMTVRFDDERDAEYNFAQVDELELAYCMTVHKSQGSEFTAVVMPVIGGAPKLMTRNLFYTALTRAKSLVVLVGREEIIREMVRNDYVLQRNTTLAKRLTEVAALLTREGGAG